jgi:hypothetical protein
MAMLVAAGLATLETAAAVDVQVLTVQCFFN